MAASAEERPPFDLASEMRSISVRAATKKNGIITMLVMDQNNSNEVIAFLSSKVSAEKLHCSDRHDRAVFTSDCGAWLQNKNEVVVWVDQSKEKVPHSWIVKSLESYRWMVGKTPLSENNPNHQFNIECYRPSTNFYWVYTVTNKLNEEVCIMRCKHMTINITYYQSMEALAKYALLSFSAQRLYVNFNMHMKKHPNIVISAMSPSTDLPMNKNEKDYIIAEADTVEHHSVDLSALVEVIFHRAGYNKALGIQYYDLYNNITRSTQLTFEVLLGDRRNSTAVLKDRSGTTILTANKLIEFMITLKSEETFSFKHFKAFKVYSPRFYDSNGNIFLEARRSRSQRVQKYAFYRFENNKNNENPQATVFNKGPNNIYTIFHNPMLDATRKMMILAWAMRETFLNFDSHTAAVPPIDYCYSRRD